MKYTKIFSSLFISMMAIGLFSGCNVTQDQAKAIAQQTGLFSAVGWIAASNPSTNQIQEVKTILVVISKNSGKITAGQSYTEVIYPVVSPIIDSTVPENDKPLCKLAAMTILNGLDTMFALNPTWSSTSSNSIDIVSSYVNGAINGLSMSESSPAMKKIRHTSNAKAKLIH